MDNISFIHSLNPEKCYIFYFFFNLTLQFNDITLLLLLSLNAFAFKADEKGLEWLGIQR